MLVKTTTSDNTRNVQCATWSTGQRSWALNSSTAPSTPQLLRSFSRPGWAPEREVTALMHRVLRYPSRVMPNVKTDGTLVQFARLGAWSLGCYEQNTGDALRSRMREWLMTPSLRRHDLNPS